jgi:cyclase
VNMRWYDMGGACRRPVITGLPLKGRKGRRGCVRVESRAADVTLSLPMLAKRVIPCLDVHNGSVTRGQQFGRAEQNGLRNVGDPVELAVRYNEQGADELVFFDITASSEGRKSILDVIERTADRCFMPLTVGGGVRTTDDMRALLRAGADKISLNSAALARPEIIAEGARAFGNQCMVVSIDAKKIAPGEWAVFARGGREQTNWEARAWAQHVVSLGAGEIVLNSIDSDGMQTGYDLEITRLISEQVPVPVVASGGAWELNHFTAVLEQGKADAVLAASVFHYGKYTIEQVKAYLAAHGIAVRR